MANRTKNVLVTGAGGFIGSHLVEHLIRNGYSVKALCEYNSFGTWGWLETVSDEVKRDLNVMLGDVRDPFGMREAVKGCDAVVHLAALIAIPYSYHSPEAYVETNVRGTLNLLQAARDLGVERFLHTSTSEVYGTAQYVPIDEKHPQVGQSPYSATKIGADQMAESFYRSFQLPVTIVRPFNAYGPRQSARAVIPTVITQLAAGKKRLQMGALKPTRDFTFVADTARGFEKALSADAKIVGQTLNLASGFEISIESMIQETARLMGVDVELEADEQRMRPENSEVFRLFGDNTKARELLGWKPEYGQLEGFRKGLAATIDWFKNPENLKLYKADRYII